MTQVNTVGSFLHICDSMSRDSSPHISDRVIALPDGRKLAFAEYGDPSGPSIMLLHGFPGSRLVWGHLPGDPFPPGIRIIAPDRPGYGRSDSKPGRTLLDWADDLRVLADRLDLATFRVIGVSGGGPGALACCFTMPDRVACAGVAVAPTPTHAPGVFEGLSRINRFFMRLATRAPRLSALNTRLVASVIRRDPGRYVTAMQRKLHAVDRTILADIGLDDVLVADFGEGLRGGVQGMVDDMAANHGGDWGFRLGNIQVPVFFWYGEFDRAVSPAMGRYLAGEVPQSRFHLVQGAGHLWPLVHLREIINTVAACGASGEVGIVEAVEAPSAGVSQS